MTDISGTTAAAEPRWARLNEPSGWVKRFIGGVRPGGRLLDLACGAGRHVRLALTMGLDVTALDRDLSRLDDLAGEARLETIVADLETGAPFPLAGRRFGGVLVTNYLYRPIMADIAALVADDGILIYETFGPGQERHGRPHDTAFHLAGNELARVALDAGLVIVGYEQGELEARSDAGSAAKIVQRIAAVGPAHAWAYAAPRPLGMP